MLPAGSSAFVDQGTNVPAPFPSPATSAPAVPAKPAEAGTYASAWTVPFSGDGPLSLTITPWNLILAGSQIETEARALADGHVIWTSKRQADTAPVVAGDVVIVPSGNQLVALDGVTGRDVWTADFTGAAQPPVVSGDTVLVASGTTLTARKAADGLPLWAANMGATATAPPASGDTLIVVALDDRTLSAFDRATGTPVWREPLDVRVLAIAVLGDRAFLSVAEGYACAHKLEHGRRDWCFPVRVRPIGPPVGDARQVYFAFLDNMVHVFDRRSGRRYFTPSLDALPAAGPVLTRDYVIVPVVTGEFVLLSLQEKLAVSRVSTPRASELPSTRAVAVAPDGGALAIVTTSAGGRYSLVYFRRQAPAPTPAETPAAPATTDAKPAEPLPGGEPTKIGGTGSGTPPKPTTP